MSRLDPFVTTKLAFLFTIVLIEDLPFLDHTMDQSKAMIPRQLSFAHLTPLAGFAAVHCSGCALDRL